VYGRQTATLVKNDTGLRYPRTVVYFKTAESEGKVHHPTQKPVALFEYLINTYTNCGDLVLDNCIGSGTTAIAALRTKRNFIGIELDPKYANICNDRIKNTEEECKDE
jgi:DNA modification methylase